MYVTLYKICLLLKNEKILMSILDNLDGQP